MCKGDSNPSPVDYKQRLWPLSQVSWLWFKALQFGLVSSYSGRAFVILNVVRLPNQDFQSAGPLKEHHRSSNLPLIMVPCLVFLFCTTANGYEAIILLYQAVSITYILGVHTCGLHEEQWAKVSWCMDQHHMGEEMPDMVRDMCTIRIFSS
ncbi:hypothetical protein VNO77_34145 [Canavalia gladiata]|uniref:Uncharacterized protein n=1 Tax=Canavalia gladiata TaxID=3824 RepID=A0AAN9Q1H9_CANGL